MKRASIFSRLLSVILVLSMLTAMVVPAMAAEEKSYTFTKVDNNRVTAKLPGRDPVNPIELESGYSEKDIVRVSIILEKAGTIDAGFETSNIAANKSAMNYQAKLEAEQEALVQKIEQVISNDLDVVWNLTLAANLISANVMYGQIEAIEAIPGVHAVVIETQYAPAVASSGGVDPNMATSGEQIGSGNAWAAGYTGAGTRIAIIDTGLDIAHEAFDASAFTYSLGGLAAKNDMSAEDYIASLGLMDADEIAGVLSRLNALEKMASVTAEDLYVNEKVPFGFNYVDNNVNLSHYDSEHGSHVAGISAANAYVASGGSYEAALDATHVQGVAPDAQLLVMKVFGTSGGAYDSDYMAAIEDAILLGADSVNLSLGSANPGMSRNATAEYQSILDGLTDSGVVVVMSAGNAGYWAEMSESGIPYLYLDDVSMQTGGSPGSYTNSLGVASVDNSGYTGTYIGVGDSNVFFVESNDYGNAPIATLAGDQEYVLVDCIGTPEEFATVGTDVLDGKIVMCYRGETSFSEKANAAVEAGAAGVIIVNNEPGLIGLNLTGYSYNKPVVSIAQADGELFKAAGTAVTDGAIDYWTGTLSIGEGTVSLGQDYYTMSSFSSWGVPGSLELKPEITAPGGNIYSVAGAVPGFIYGHDNYELMSGTSMAAPQVAGMAALMVQYIEANGLEEKTGLDARTLAQSMLMSTAEPILDGASEYYYPVIQQGAGLANIGNATSADSYILMDKNATASYADGKVKAELGDDPEKTGTYTFSFTINNLTDVEKTYALSADIFTQNAFVNSGIFLMDTWTTPLAPSVTWTVNGKAVENGAALEGMDFNGDGVVSTLDGQALLDYATGVKTELTNKDKADLNADGKVNSYDSYLFFSLLNKNGAVVPANGSATVTATITLSAADKEWLSYYENGAYIEGYVYAEGLSTVEGVEGTAHSIPVLGFYGNWTDASMYDKGSFLEYKYGLENRPPYLYNSVMRAGMTNSLFLEDAYGDVYYVGGDPLGLDETYMPERDAISGINGDVLNSIGFTLIRNAADAMIFVKNAATGEYLLAQEITGADPLYSAFYYTNGQTWEYVWEEIGLGLSVDVLPNNMPIEVGITAAPEYYVDAEGNVDWAALGKGATFSQTMVVDNEAPALIDVSLNSANNTLDVEVSDNQYIAAVMLIDSLGQHLYTYEGSVADAEAGDKLTYALDLTGVNGNSFLLQVIDYANNVTTYELNEQIGSIVDTIEGVRISQNSAVMQMNNTLQLSAIVTPVNASNRNVTWSSTDTNVVTVDENGLVTAVGVGTANIVAAAVLDNSKTASCRIEVINISTDLNGIVWDEEGSIWFSEFNTAELPDYVKLSGDMLDTNYLVSAATAPNGKIYACSLNTSSANGGGYMYVIDPQTWEATQLAACEIQGLHIFFSDLTYAPAIYGTGALIGSWGTYLFTIDPETGMILEIIDEFDLPIVGVATCFGDFYEDDQQSEDTLYVILNDGTIVQELYIYTPDLSFTLPYYMYWTGGERAAFDSGISVGDAWYYNSAYYDKNNGHLYWSAHETNVDNDVTLYVIDEMNDFQTYELGKFADGVWPVAGLHQLSVTPPLTIHSAPTEEMQDISALIAENSIEQRQFVLEAREVKANAARGGVNSVIDYKAPVDARSAADSNSGFITVDVTANDATGKTVDSTNGVSTITYDAKELELVTVKVNGDYVSVNKGEGSVTIGYVAMDAIEADKTVATLVFQPKDGVGDTDVSVTHKEVGAAASGHVEKLSLECVHKTTKVVGAKPATCTEDGYTGDTVCTVCGDKVAVGVITKATGHTYESVVTAPTTTAKGYTTHTCAVCGHSYVDSYVDKLPINPDTGDNFSMGLMTMLALASLVGAVLVINETKKRSF